MVLDLNCPKHAYLNLCFSGAKKIQYKQNTNSRNLFLLYCIFFSVQCSKCLSCFFRSNCGGFALRN